MQKVLRPVIAVAILAIAGATLWLLLRPPEKVTAIANVSGLSPTVSDLTGYDRAMQSRQFVFPRDHGSHDSFQTEWWYYTGNLTDPNGRHFGYQLTFFRRALLPMTQMPTRTSQLATNQIYFAHFALTDSYADSHTAAERFSRGAGGLAGATGDPFRVFLETWSAVALDPVGDQIQITARDGATSISLQLRTTKPIVTHGNAGLSPKSNAPGNASYYYSYTRLATQGVITTANGAYQVTGASWMDHEWSTSALGPNAQGWDWFALQLDNGVDLMLFQVRNNDGSIDFVSGGTLVDATGHATPIKREQMELEVLERWHSPSNNADYPVRWRLKIPDYNLSLEISARIKNQEMLTSVVYWEGAVVIQGSIAGAPVSGVGYLEMTGYSGTLNGKF